MKRTEILCYILFTGAVLISPARKNFVSTTEKDSTALEPNVFPVGLQTSQEALIQGERYQISPLQPNTDPGKVIRLIKLSTTQLPDRPGERSTEFEPNQINLASLSGERVP